MKKTVQFTTNDYICGNVTKDFDCNIFEISFYLLKPIENHMVYRAYFLDKNSTNLINIGVVETTEKEGFLKVKNDFCKSTIVIMLKDTKTEENIYICAGFFEEVWNVQGILYPSKMRSEVRQIFTTTYNKIDNYEKIYIDDKMFYKISDFLVIPYVSAVKCILFDKNVLYSFDKYGYYLLSIENNEITIGVISIDEKNPLAHLNEFSFESNGIYFVKIILEDDGQYFEK